jgi:hypothetical protein
MSIIKDLAAEDMQQNVKALAGELQASLPLGLKCAVFIFTEGPGPVAMAHASDRKKLISVLEDAVKKLKNQEHVGRIQ